MKNFYWAPLIALCTFAVHSMEQTELEFSINAVRPLRIPLHPLYQKRAIIQIKALLEQDDMFSCVFRSFFHARCIEFAAQQAALTGIPFEKKLPSFLADTELLHNTYTTLKNWLATLYPGWKPQEGMEDHHITQILCLAPFSELQEKILPIDLKNDTLWTLHNFRASKTRPLLYYPTMFPYCDRDPDFLTKETNPYVCRLTSSAELDFQLSRLAQPLQPAHFLCSFHCKGEDWHTFLTSLIRLPNNTIRTYTIESSNQSIEDIVPAHTIVTQLAAYAKAINTQSKRRKVTL